MCTVHGYTLTGYIDYILVIYATRAVRAWCPPGFYL